VKQCRGKAAEEVMSDEWRAKRRAQEKRAGRWTDDTLRQNQIWEAFSWVLDADDPRANVWPQAKEDDDDSEADDWEVDDAEYVFGQFGKLHLPLSD
jgi:hypothetical protein